MAAEREEAIVGEEMVEEKMKAEALVVRWETILPRASVRVLLVEADGSTREIVGALLRKCGYRVAAAADGAKAWEILKDKPHSIDLVLTEIEVPSVSGFSLLTMISENESCKDIPVIMMSSHDSINMVFKCMLKGAADFLVKPIRKNELRNLWQHVWRRYSSNSDYAANNGNPDERHGLEDDSIHVTTDIECAKRKSECCEKESDAQSSCATPGMELRSGPMQNVQEIEQIPLRRTSIKSRMRFCEGAKIIKPMDKKWPYNCEAEDNSLMFTSEEPEKQNDKKITHDENHENSEAIYQNDTDQEVFCFTHENERTFDESKLSNKITDLLGAMDDKVQKCHNVGSRSNVGCKLAKAFKTDVNGNDQLELSLRRCESSSSESGNDTRNILKHSASSAFSRYKNKGVESSFPESPGSPKEKKDSLRCSSQCSHGPTCTCQSNGLTFLSNGEDANSFLIHLSNQVSEAVQNMHAGMLPFPIPAIANDNMLSGVCYSLQHMIPSQPGPPPWCYNAMVQKPMPLDVSNMSTAGTPNSEQTPCAHTEEVIHKSGEHHLVKNLKSGEEEGQSGNSNMCDDADSHLNYTGCVNISTAHELLDTDGVTKMVYHGVTEGSCDDRMVCHGETKPTNSHRSILRQEALIKFRLKRKDRCYEKKVRYESRKKLAEQRPRVKGQFVRQVVAASQ